MVYRSLILVYLFLAVFVSAQDQQKRSIKNVSWNDNSSLVSIGTGTQVYFAYYKLYTNDFVPSYTISNVNTQSVFYAKYEISRGKFGFGISLCRSILNFNVTEPNSASTFTYSLNEIVYAGIIRVNYHFFMNRAIDVYVGLGGGFRGVNYSADSTSVANYYSRPLAGEATVGIRYLFASRFGLYAESGLGRALFQVGITINVGKKY